MTAREQENYDNGVDAANATYWRKGGRTMYLDALMYGETVVPKIVLGCDLTEDSNRVRTTWPRYFVEGFIDEAIRLISTAEVETRKQFEVVEAPRIFRAPSMLDEQSMRAWEQKRGLR